MDTDITVEGQRMNRNRIEGNCKQVNGRVKEQWGRLTGVDLDGRASAAPRTAISTDA